MEKSDDVMICEASGIQFQKRNGQWSWRTMPEGGKNQVVAFSWRSTGRKTKADAARDCRDFCGFGK